MTSRATEKAPVCLCNPNWVDELDKTCHYPSLHLEGCECPGQAVLTLLQQASMKARMCVENLCDGRNVVTQGLELLVEL